jgi:uncharacterized protein (TIGR04255 family)
MALEGTSTERVSFENPPLNEVVFSVQFESDVIDEVGILARFLGKVEDRYPRLEKQPPVAPATETFDQPPQPAIQFQLLSGPPSHRYWFLSPDGTLIVQVQADRLMFNWRQVQGDEEYPRYETLCPEFVRLLGLFVESLPDGVDAKPAWCELQYINPIPVAGDALGTHGQLARILNYLVRDPPREALPPVEDTQLQQRFRITGSDGSPSGRLYVTAVPGLRQSDMQPAYVLTLLARGKPDTEAVPDGVVGFLDRAHDLIVHGFVEVTTAEMHAEWVLKEGGG